ncbi:MAG: RNA methyltransferase [Bacteroidales bacterium]|nr:RNA methyltransferase [Bacteroidales bacterium]
MRKLSMEELNRLSTDDFKLTSKTPLTIVLDNIRSLSNVGSIFRTADAFLVEEIILCGITATPPHKEIQKTALGATESVKWSYQTSTEEAVKALINKGIKVFAVEQTNEKIWLQDFKVDNSIPLALIFGNEVKGVGDEVLALVDGSIEIPQFGSKHSLNISIAAGILIWEVYRKLNFRPVS